MEMVGHDNKVVKQIFPLFAVAEKNIHEQVGGGGAPEKCSALRGHRGDEKCALHHRRVVPLGGERCEWSHVEIVRLFRGRAGLQARVEMGMMWRASAPRGERPPGLKASSESTGTRP